MFEKRYQIIIVVVFDCMARGQMKRVRIETNQKGLLYLDEKKSKYHLCTLQTMLCIIIINFY